MDGRTAPLVAVVPSAIWPHPSQQDRFAKIGPDCRVDRAFLQRHLPWLRQYERIGSLNTLAAIGATEAKNNRNAVHASDNCVANSPAMVLPQHPWPITIPCTRAEPGTFNQRIE